MPLVAADALDHAYAGDGHAGRTDRHPMSWLGDRSDGDEVLVESGGVGGLVVSRR